MPSAKNSTLTNWYRNRIGEPSTEDEAVGYWVFALGAILGVLGILLFLVSRPAGVLREWSIVFASAGLVLLVAGPIIRLPLQRSATWLVYIGAIIGGIAILWFIATFPQGWSTQTGQPRIIGLYSIGLIVLTVGGVFIPILTDRRDLESEISGLQAELDELRESLLDTEADEADLANVIADLRNTLIASEADEHALVSAVDQLRQNLTDTEADEADLAVQLRLLRTSQSRFELYQDRGEQWRWRLRHRNGNLIADSGEGYTRRFNAQNGIESVRRDALGASLFVYEDEEELPDTEEEFEPVVEVVSDAKFELYEDNAGEFRWRLRHDNGEIIADGSEGYASRGSVETAVGRIREYVGPADYVRPDPTAFEVYRDRGGEWRWRFVHRNGNIIADSGEGYSRRSGARRAINRIRDRFDSMEVEVYEDRAGEHRWRLRGGNNQLMADSGEGYDSRDGVEAAVDRLREYVPNAQVLEIGRAAFEVFEDSSGEFRWRLRHRNGNILADSGEGYGDRSGAWDAIESVKRNAPNASTGETS